MDEEGNLYLYKAALLCKDEIIKRLINGTYHVADPSTIGSLFTLLCLKETHLLATLNVFTVYKGNDRPRSLMFFSNKRNCDSMNFNKACYPKHFWKYIFSKPISGRHSIWRNFAFSNQWNSVLKLIFGKEFVFEQFLVHLKILHGKPCLNIFIFPPILG